MGNSCKYGRNLNYIKGTDIPACDEISIEITERCLAKCIHCSSEATEEGWDNELCLEEIKEIILEGKERLETKVISLSGGEPVLHKNYGDIVRFVKELGLNILVYTCGIYETYFDDFSNSRGIDCSSGIRNLADRIKSQYFAEGDKVIFSLEGSNACEHDFITRISGSFEATLEYIRDLSERGIFVEVHCCPSVVNCDSIEDIICLVKNVGARRISFLRLVPQGRCSDKRWLLVKGSKWLDLQKKLAELYCKYGDFIRVGDPLNFMWYYDSRILNSTCSAGLNRILIRANGETQFCAALKHAPEYDYGNIRDPNRINSIGDQLEWIWVRSYIVKQLRDFHLKAYRTIEHCDKCGNLDICRGGCLSQRIAYHGNMYLGPDPLCPIALEKGTLNGEA